MEEFLEPKVGKIQEVIVGLNELIDGGVFIDPWPLADPEGGRWRFIEGGVGDYREPSGRVHLNTEIGRGITWAPRTLEQYDSDELYLIGQAYEQGWNDPLHSNPWHAMTDPATRKDPA